MTLQSGVYAKMETNALVQRALSLLSQPIPKAAPDASRMGATLVIEPTAPNARPIYWERASGEIVGPAQPEFLAKVGEGQHARYWLVAQFQGGPVWVNSIVLRSRKSFEQQVRPKAIELIRVPR